MKQTRARKMILVTVILMDILVGAEIDLFLPSFPELQKQFALTPFWLESLLSANFAGFCLSLFFVGDIADRHGRKFTILVGMVIFIFGSILCLFSPFYQFFIFGRFLQGLGIASPATLCFLIIADSYPLKKQQSLMAMLNGIINASVALAPVIGCYITMYFHWQGNFVILLFMGILVFIMTFIFIPNNVRPYLKQESTFGGYLLIFKSKSMILLISCIIFTFVPYWVFVGMTPILYMEDLGVSLTHFGYYQGSLALIFSLGSILSSFLIAKFNQTKFISISIFICIFSGIIIIFEALYDIKNPLFITFSFIPFTIGCIIPSTVIYPICLNFISEAKGKVSAILQGGRLLLTGISLQIAGYYYQGSFQNIGIIIAIFIFLSVITTFYVTKNNEIMRFAQRED